MKQFEVDEEIKVAVDYTDLDIPDSARTLRPLVYEQGDGFCAILGPDPQVGIFGCGPTPKEALWDWDKHLNEFKTRHEEEDEVAIYLEQVLANNGQHEKLTGEITDDMPFETPNAKGLS